jgi:hypothetical protein
MEYNTDRDKLIIPEYGRNIQKMIQYCNSIEERDERNRIAKAIIEVMGNLNPHLRDVPDFKHKLWDQLFIMSDFKLDVDSPYEIPSQETFEARPDRIPYPEKSKKYRFYGINLKNMIAETIKKEDGEEKDALILVLANHMKKSYLVWNRDVVDDETIFEHLYELSGQKFDLRNKNISLSYTQDDSPAPRRPKRTFDTNRRNKNYRNRKQ